MKPLLFLLAFSSLYADDFSERMEKVDAVWGYIGNLILLVIAYMVIKNSLDLFFKFKNKSLKNIEKIPIFNFSNTINEYKNTTLISIVNYVKNKLNDSFIPNITSVNSEMLKISLKSKHFLTYSIYIKTNGGYSKSENVSSDQLERIGHKEGKEFISERKNLTLFKEHLNNVEFGQHLPILKSFSPNYDYNHTCYSCGGSGDEMCYDCNGSGSITERVRRYYTDDHGDEQSETEDEIRTCNGCGGSGYITCVGCGGSGHQYDYALIKIEINSSYVIDDISNKDDRLIEGLEKNLLLNNISTVSKTTQKNFEINDFEINGTVRFESPYAKSDLLFKNKKYEIKTFGIKGDVLDISELGEDLFKEEFKAFSDNDLNWFGFLNIRKQENYLKNFFKYKSNQDIFKDYVDSKDKDMSAIKNKYSVESKSIEKMVSKTREMLLNLKKFSSLYSLIIGMVLFIGVESVASIRTGSFSWFFPLYMLIIPISALIGSGYFYLRIKLMLGETFLKFIGKENIDEFSITFWPFGKK